VGLSAALNNRREAVWGAETEAIPSAGAPPDLPNADDPVQPAPGTRPEYTPVEDHYQVSINLRAPVRDMAAWTLAITGLVDNPLTLTLDDIRNNYAPIDRYVTLSCISNPVGGDLIGTTRWTGASLRAILNDAGLQPQARFLKITSADGFHETLDLSVLNTDERIMLCYAWDGQPLTEGHGAPLRIYIPDRYGMKQPKWITEIEATETYEEGYWVRRGWDEVARMQTTSVIDTVATDALIEEGDRTLVPIGGIAHAGDRGISKVEVQVDDGAWVEAQLRGPLSDTTWVIWRYDWPFQAGPHTFRVRCYEGGGVLQSERSRGAHPSGATGIHVRRLTV
jgi:DMSO/TMAO reductase YedYZ molybdopterin-dependent catalytic subunit